MQNTVEVAEERVANLVRQRIAEPFSYDARFRETGVRDLLRRIVDEAATTAVRSARDAIAIEKATKRGLVALRKLYAGFDPAKLKPEQQAWLEKQTSEAGNKRDE